jgi:hypothetical protein
VDKEDLVAVQVARQEEDKEEQWVQVARQEQMVREDSLEDKSQPKMTPA